MHCTIAVSATMINDSNEVYIVDPFVFKKTVYDVQEYAP